LFLVQRLKYSVFCFRYYVPLLILEVLLVPEVTGFLGYNLNDVRRDKSKTFLHMEKIRT
jgi:hypothetical protein